MQRIWIAHILNTHEVVVKTVVEQVNSDHIVSRPQGAHQNQKSMTKLLILTPIHLQFFKKPSIIHELKEKSMSKLKKYTFKTKY